MTRVEGENTRLRHYLARLHRKTLCYSKSLDMLKYLIATSLPECSYCNYASLIPPWIQQRLFFTQLLYTLKLRLTVLD